MTERRDTDASMHMERVALAGYATGALSEAERRSVADHLEGCRECRAELESVKKLHAGVRDAFDAEPEPSPRVKRAVLARVVGDPHAASPGVAHLPRRAISLGRLGPWLRAPSVPRWMQVAAIALIVIQAGLLVRTIPNPGTAATDVTPRGLTRSATRLRVVFNPLATQAQTRELLGSMGARIVDGPRPNGEYLIELTAADPKMVSERLRKARAHADVLQAVDLAPP